MIALGYLPEWTIRPMTPEDAGPALAMRTRTRENAVTRKELEEVYGVTPASAAEALRTSQSGWICEENGKIAGFAIGDRATGEVVVVALLPEYEGQGIGRRLLSLVQDRLYAAGHEKIWLLANPDPEVRASGFYARMGWVNTGRMQGEDVILERPR